MTIEPELVDEFEARLIAMQSAMLDFVKAGSLSPENVSLITIITTGREPQDQIILGDREFFPPDVLAQRLRTASTTVERWIKDRAN